MFHKNVSIKKVKLENNWLKNNWFVKSFTVLLVSISQSDESVNWQVLTSFYVSTGQNEESTNNIYVIVYTVVSFVGNSAWSVNVGSFSQILPIMFSDPAVQ